MNLPIVEHFCRHDTCEHRGTYDLLATCYTCGEKHIARITKGHGHFEQACPHCGNYRIGYGSSQQAADAMAVQWAGVWSPDQKQDADAILEVAARRGEIEPHAMSLAERETYVLGYRAGQQKRKP